MLASDHPGAAKRRPDQYLISFDKPGINEVARKRYATFDSPIVLIHWMDEKGRLNFDVGHNVVASNFILATTGIMFQTRQLERDWWDYESD